MIAKPRVSVIIPVYNTEKYLCDCLDSVTGQTLKELEIICVDDFSSDRSIEILQNYAQKDERIAVICFDENRGQSSARNRGMKEARGEYMYFMDSDDVLADFGALERLYQLAAAENLEGIFFGFKTIRYSDEKVLKVFTRNNCGTTENGHAMLKDMVQSGKMCWSACVQFWNTEYLRKINIKFMEGIIHEDVLFTFEALRKSQKVKCIPDILYIYRKRENSTTTTIDTRHLEAYIILYSEIYKTVLEGELEDIEEEACEILDMLHNFFLLLKNRFPENPPVKVTKPIYLHTYDLMCGKHKMRKYLERMLAIKAQISMYEKIIVFGAGRVAEEIIDILQDWHRNIIAIAVSKKENNPSYFHGYQVCELQELKEAVRNTIVVIATSERYSLEIKKYVEQYKFQAVTLF